MLSKDNRKLIMKAVGQAVDSLVRDLYSSRDRQKINPVQEPEITSRICQRVEDKLDGEVVGDYKFHVMAMSMPDRGNKSAEKVTGADIILSVSLDGPDGFDKALLIQAKYDTNVSKSDLIESCERMHDSFGPKGAYVWIYTSEGVKVLSPHQVAKMKNNNIGDVGPRSVEGFVGRILDCYAGSQRNGIPPGADRRRVMKEKIKDLRAANSIDIDLEQVG